MDDTSAFKVIVKSMPSYRNENAYYYIMLEADRIITPQPIAKVFNYDWAIDFAKLVADRYSADIENKTGKI